MRPLHIAVTADPYLPVPPTHYGGIERVVDLLVRGLAARGHRVTLFAHPDSRGPAELFPYGHPPHHRATDRLLELAQLGSGLWGGRRRFDVVHSFGRLAALAPLLPLRALPKLQCYQRPIPWTSVARATRIAGRSIAFAACSRALLEGHDGPWFVVHNAVDLALYPAVPAVDGEAPLVFLGRLEPIKGVHHAIAIARAAGRRLVIAGNRVEEGSSRGYFDREIAPHLDGERVRWVGAVDDAAKAALLGAAAALLMPVEWDEPFGIVMAEALACGTPVVGFPRGSVPEVVREGTNGFVCPDVAASARAIARLGELSRAEVRRDCERRFSGEALVDAYERVYGKLLGGAS